jgi:hypothetical protein
MGSEMNDAVAYADRYGLYTISGAEVSMMCLTWTFTVSSEMSSLFAMS